MATKTTVNKKTGIFSIAACGAAAVAGYSIYLMQTGQSIDVQAAALSETWYQLKPDWAKMLIAQGGFTGTATAILLEASQAALLFGVGFAAYAAYDWFTDQKSQSAPLAKPETDDSVNSAEIVGSELMIMLPTYKSADGKTLGGAVDKNPYQQNFYRISRTPVAFKEGVTPTVYQRLYASLFSMLKAHPEWPASIGTHHADASLFEHSQSVSKMVQNYYRERKIVEPLAAIAGLAHDIDKLLAYNKTSSGFAKNVNATHHNKFSAYIVSTQPEFRELPEDERNALTLALRYYHDPDNLPIGASPRTETLIQALRVCDGLAIQEEKKEAVKDFTPEHLALITDAAHKTITELNINGYLSKEGHFHGWTTPAIEFLLIPVSTLIEQIGKHLPAELSRRLQLDHETRSFSHPAVRIITEQFRIDGSLLTSYKGMSSPLGLYDCRIGASSFYSVLMLDKAVIDQKSPGLSPRWGTAPYKIRVMQATEDIRTQDEPEEETKKDA